MPISNNLNWAQKLKPAIDKIAQAKSVVWPSLDHSKTDFNGNDTVVFTRQGVVPMFDVRKNGAAPANVNVPGSGFGEAGPSERLIAQQIRHGMYQKDPAAIGPEQYYDQERIYDIASFVPMKQFTKTLTQEKKWNGEFKDSATLFTGISNEIANFMAEQVSKVVIPAYDRYAIEKVTSYVPAENRFALNYVTGNLYKTFAALNDKIKNAEYTDPSGLTIPQEGSGKKILLVTSAFLQRLVLDLPLGAGIASEHVYSDIVNGFVGKLLGWEIIECHKLYMPYVRDANGDIVVDANGKPVHYQAVAYDPETIVAPLITDQILKDETRVLDFSTFIKGHHLYDCFLNADDEWIAAGNKDREQLLGAISFVDAAGDPIDPTEF